MGNVKISIIVPIYNVSKYLKNCLTSLVSQTMSDIEVICVDDKSTDNSLEIIQQFAASDQRIIPVTLSVNSGICVARKQGVIKARGEYIMFCDGDDELEPDACEIICQELQKNPSDIIQFGTKVVYCNEYPKQQKDNLENALMPYTRILKRNLIAACFEEHKFGYTIWNKAYNAGLCKKVFSLIGDEHIVVSEDLYINFLMLYFANSYHGITDVLYCYHYGSGVTGLLFSDLEQFKRFCNSLDILPLLKKFLNSQNADENIYKAYDAICDMLIRGCVYQWRYYLSISYAQEGYQFLRNRLGSGTLVSELARGYWNEKYELIKRIIADETISIRGKRSIRRLGIYYHRLYNGGVEKVLSELMVLWSRLGYELVLFTDEEPSPNDYPISVEVRRIVLPSFQTSVESKYKERAVCWEKIIKKLNIDTVIYNSCTSESLFWDVCLLKGLECNIIVETHSMFAGSMWYSPLYSSYLPFIYRMVDCVVCLSRVDLTFWKNFCPAVYIQNPIKISKFKKINKNTKNILWVGRIAKEKQPEDVLKAFALVVREIPEATLTIVGSGENHESIRKLIELSEKLKIREKVEFAGFQLNVEEYYQKASIFALTSMSESFSLVLAESKSYGVPVVMYNLPNLELVRDQRGIITVPQKDIYKLSRELTRLLSDDDLRKQLGEEGRCSIEEYSAFDVSKAWKDLFGKIENGLRYEPDENTRIMLDLLLQNMYRGVEGLMQNYSSSNPLTSSIEALTETVQRHEEVVNRHEEVVNRHEKSINHQWEVQKWHEERLRKLEAGGVIKRTLRRIKHGLTNA